MEKKQRVGAMADEILARQAKARAERTGESFEEALKAVRKTEAGRQLEELSQGPHRDKRAEEWQEDMSRERAEERAASTIREERDRLLVERDAERERAEELRRELEEMRGRGFWRRLFGG
jgi:hypothetical protein